MRAENDGGEQFWDPIYGGGGSGRGRAGSAFNRLMRCVRLIRDEEFSDEAAVEMIRQAAGNQRGVLHSFAEGFMARDWYGDPLLTHVADLVRAAERGRTAPSPLDAASSEVVRDERRLLKLSPAEVFADLAARQPALQDWARRASDPEWRAAQDMNPVQPPSPPGNVVEVAPGVWASESAPRPSRWLIHLMAKRVERSWSKRMTDPRWAEFQRSTEEARSHEGSMLALGQELDRLVGPRAETADRLVRTLVAHRTLSPYIWELTGLPWPSPPPM